jgi:TolA-binding protein
MIMPFIRLVAIYVIVIVAAVAFFKRDRIMEATGRSFDAAPSQATAKAEPPATPEPVVQTVQPAASEKTDDPAPEVATESPRPEPAPLVQPTATAPLVQPTATVQPAPSPAPASAEARLSEARNAYWSGDMAGAEALFTALARDLPDNADAHGELGNILFAQRRYGEAADAYLATGKLLVNTGRRAQAIPLITVLQSIAPQKAAVLRNLVTN